MSQIIRITSEALQQTVRRLLPSQQGFGEDLQASNVIQPVIDLTPTAEGSQLPIDLRTAVAFGSQTAFNISNAETSLGVTPGFIRLIGTIQAKNSSTQFGQATIQLSSPLVSNKIIFGINNEQNTGVDQILYLPFDLIVFVKSQDDIVIGAGSTARIFGSHRQIADLQGNLVNPSGFEPG